MRVSVKQLNMFGCLQRPSIGGCPRSWGFNYLDKVRKDWLDPPLVDGIKFHACMASLINSGTMPEPGELQPGVFLQGSDVGPEGHFGRMARAALIYLPNRDWALTPSAKQKGLGWTVEGEYLFPWRTEPHGVECEIDLRPDLHSDNVGRMVFVDWKSTSDKRFSLKTLEDDVQANAYAFGLMELFGKIEVDARWVYVSKKTYDSWPVDFTFRRQQTTEWLHRNIDATIELIHTFRDAKLAALDLPGDLEACGGVGRFCDFKDRCLTGPVGELPSRLISLNEIVRYKEGKPL